jgi:biopolymer transport protein ExbD
VSTLTERRFFEMCTVFWCGIRYQPSVDGLVLTTSRDGKYYWDKEGPFLVSELEPRFQQWMKTAKSPSVLIAAEQDAKWEDAVSLLEVVWRTGVESALFEARTRAAPIAAR